MSMFLAFLMLVFSFMQLLIAYQNNASYIAIPFILFVISIINITRIALTAEWKG